MSDEVTVLVCAPGAVWELPLLRGLQRRELGVRVLRRCTDPGELLGIALRDEPTAIVVDATVPWLDRDYVTALRRAGITVFALGSTDRDLGGFGVRQLPADIDAEHLTVALHEVDQRAVRAPASSIAVPTGPSAGCGQLLAVWSGPGAPGRTTVALHLAIEAARSGRRVLLIDADAWAASIAQLLELPETPSVAQAARAAAAGWSQPLSEFLQSGPDGLLVLAGLPHAELWPEVPEATWRSVLAAARVEFDLVVVDVAAPVDEDEELVIDRIPFRRNLMTTLTLEQADRVLLVASADPVGLRRGIVAHHALRDLLDPRAEDVAIVLNRAPRPGRRLQDCSRAVGEWVGVPPAAILPTEEQLERVAWEGRPLHALAPRSRWLRELRALVEMVAA